MTREQIITAVWLPLSGPQEVALVGAADGNGKVSGGRLSVRAALVGNALATWDDPHDPRTVSLTAAGYMYAAKLRAAWAGYGDDFE